jgi:hypothetical protein
MQDLERRAAIAASGKTVEEQPGPVVSRYPLNLEDLHFLRGMDAAFQERPCTARRDECNI